MNEKLSLQQVETLLKLTLLQRKNVQAQLEAITSDDKLTADERLNLLSEMLNPVGKDRE